MKATAHRNFPSALEYLLKCLFSPILIPMVQLKDSSLSLIRLPSHPSHLKSLSVDVAIPSPVWGPYNFYPKTSLVDQAKFPLPLAML